MQLFGFDILKFYAASFAEAFPRLFNPVQKAWIVLQAVIEPIIFRLETDQQAGWLSVPCDDNLLRLGLAEKSGEIILDL